MSESLCDKIERYTSTHNGVSWSNSASTWTSFPWNSLTTGESGFIIKQYQSLVRKSDGTLVPHGSAEHYGRFKFFMEINLSPTLEEYWGFNRYDFWGENTKDQNKVPMLRTLYSNNFSNSVFIGGSSLNRGYFKNLPDRKNYDYAGKKIDSIDQFYTVLKSKSDLYTKTFTLPTMEEYKLSWMRELVERGIEGEMGPFEAKSFETNGTPRQIKINGFDTIINDRTNYPMALYKHWLAKEYHKSLQSNYRSNEFPKTDPDLLKELHKSGGKLASNSKFRTGTNTPETILMTMVASGAGGMGNGWWNKKSIKNENGEDVFVYANEVKPIKEFKPFRMIKDSKNKSFRGLGTRPNPDKNYVMTGWVELPQMFGWGVCLPWAFVWQYIDAYGYVFQKDITSQGETWIDESKTVTFLADQQFHSAGGNKEYKRFNSMNTTDENTWLNNNIRSRLWWYRYGTKDIPNREIYFYIRYKYGVAGSTGPRWMAYNVAHDANGKALSGSDDIKLIIDTAIKGAESTWQALLENAKKSLGLKPEDADKIKISIIGNKKYRDNPRYLFSNTLPNWCGGVENTQPKGTFEKKYPLTGIGDTGTAYVKSMSDSAPGFPANRLRSHYASLVHDIIGYERLYEGKYNSDREKESEVKIKGEISEIVNYTTGVGKFTYISGKSDRAAIAVGQLTQATIGNDNTNLYDFHESYASQDIRPNHLCLSQLIDSQTKSTEKVVSGKDRFISPQFPISDNNVKVEFYNRARNPDFTFKDFAFGLFTPKELQFLYECVSYIQYGTLIETAGGQLLPPKFWPTTTKDTDKNFFKNRWSELSFNILADTTGAIGASYETQRVYLRDYILWAAPTDYQYHKIDFSKVKDGCVNRAYGLDKIKNVVNIDSFPFVKNFVNVLYNNRPGSAARPLSPAWVHYNYISGLINIGGGTDKYVDGLKTDDGKNSVIRWNDSTKKWDDDRSLGLEINDSVYQKVFGNKDSGVLLTLPNFVLGGRPDLIGMDLKPISDPDSWDSTWGSNPFSMKDGILQVGDLDDVIDNWAKQKSHNGKFVSAMEIMFWIRYRHGLASAPTHRTIKHYVPENDFGYFENDEFWYGQWPITELKKNIEVGDEGRQFRGITKKGFNMAGNADDVLTPIETMQNIPILTSYYFPIMSENSMENIKKYQSDPLIEFKLPERWNNDERTAFTGWNSDYVCNWPGADKVNDIDTLNNVVSTIIDIFKDYPSNSVIRDRHLRPSIIMHQEIIKIQSKLNASAKKTNWNSTGFNENNFIKISHIQASFRAMKMIQLSDMYQEYIHNGLEKKAGERGSVIEVKGYVTDETGTEKESLIYISGEPVGARRSELNNQDSRYIDLAVRPWLEYGGMMNQKSLENLTDDFELGVKDCEPKYIFMRHLILPSYWVYNSPRYKPTDSNPKGSGPVPLYSPEQNFLTNDFMSKLFLFHSQNGKDLGTYHNMAAKLTGEQLRYVVFSVNNGLDNMSSESVKKIKNQKTSAIQGKYVFGSGIEERIKTSIKSIKKSSSTWYPISKAFLSVIGSASSGLEVFAMADNVRSYTLSSAYRLGHTLHSLEGGLAVGLIAIKFMLLYYKFDLKWSIIGTLGNVALHWVLGMSLKGVQYALAGKFAGLAPSALFGPVLSGMMAAAATTGVFIVITLAAIALDTIIDNYASQEKINKFWKKLHEANKKGYLEGPYVQTDGIIKIKKINGLIPSGDKKQPEITNQVNKFESVPITDPETVGTNESRTDEFYSSGKAKKIVQNLSDCECTLLMDLIKPEYKGRYGERTTDWNKGLFRRQLSYPRTGNRSEILDDAPDIEDLPNLRKQDAPPEYKSAMKVLGLTLWEEGNIEIREKGSSGTTNVFTDGARLGRFLWPETLFGSHTNLCDYMPLNGKYPTALRDSYQIPWSSIRGQNNWWEYIINNVHNDRQNGRKLKITTTASAGGFGGPESKLLKLYQPLYNEYGKLIVSSMTGNPKEIPYYNYAESFLNIDTNTTQMGDALYPSNAMASIDTGTTGQTGTTNPTGAAGGLGGRNFNISIASLQGLDESELYQVLYDPYEMGGGGSETTTGGNSQQGVGVIQDPLIQYEGLTFKMMDTFDIGYMGITPVMSGGKQKTSNSYTRTVDGKRVNFNDTSQGATAPIYDFIVGIPPGKSEFNSYVSSGNYDGKYKVGGKLDFDKATNGAIKNHWTDRNRVDGKGKYRNYINWSLFETRGTGWGSGQPTGIFVKDGVYYGAKPNTYYFGSNTQIVAAKINGKMDVVNAEQIWQNKQKLQVKSGVSIAAGGSFMIINNNVVNVSSGASTFWPFFGKGLLKDGKQKFFAGIGSGTPRGLGNKILKYFKQIGGFVQAAGVGDGGGSTTMVIDGQWLHKTIKAGPSEGRPVPIIIYWD